MEKAKDRQVDVGMGKGVEVIYNCKFQKAIADRMCSLLLAWQFHSSAMEFLANQGN